MGGEEEEEAKEQVCMQIAKFSLKIGLFSVPHGQYDLSSCT